MVNLLLSEEGDLTVRSCEVVTARYRNRTTFASNPHPSEVFNSKVTKSIEDCVFGVGPESKIVALPDLILELPGALMKGATIMLQQTEDCTCHLILRFQQFLGHLGALFLPEVGFGDGLSHETDRLTALAFSDLALPILNILEHEKQLEKFGPIGDPLFSRVGEVAGEIGFHIEILKRFIESSEQKRVLDRDDMVDENCLSNVHFLPVETS